MAASKDAPKKPTTGASAPRPASAPSGPTDFSSVHLWHIQAVRDVAVFALAIGVFYVGFLMRVVTVPLLLGLLLAYLTEPIVRTISRRTGRSIAAGVVIAAFYVLVGVPLVAGTGLALLQGARLVQEVQQDLPALREKADDLLKELDRLGNLGIRGRAAVEADAPAGSEPGAAASPPPGEPGAEGSETPAANGAQGPAGANEPVAKPADPLVVFTWLESYLAEHKGAIGKSIAGGGVKAFSLGFSILTSVGLFGFKAFFLVPFFFYFCSVGLGAVARFGVSLIPKRNRERWLDILSKMDDTISAFIRGRLLICLILAVLFTVGFWLARVPAPLLIGPIVGLLAFVPYLAIVGWLIAMAMLIITQAGEANPMPWYWMIAGPTLVYWAVQTIDDYLLTPLIQGKRMGLDTPMILVALLGAASIAGVYGVLVAIPAAACLKILVVEVFWPRYKQWAEGKAEDPLPISAE